MVNIKNYNLLKEVTEKLGGYYYKEILDINYSIDIDNDYSTKLLISFFIKTFNSKKRFNLKMQYNEVSEFTLKKVTNMCINNLIIESKKEFGWENDKRYHVHDDSNYGEHDGFDLIDFFCESIEVVSIDEF